MTFADKPPSPTRVARAGYNGGVGNAPSGTGTASRASGSSPAARSPDFREIARVLGVEGSRELARRAQLLLARVIEEAPRLQREFAPVLSSKGGKLRLCGTTSAGEAKLSWDDSRGCDALRAPADFHLETGATKDRRRYRARTAFATLLPISAEAELAAVGALTEQLHGTDAELRAAASAQFPHLYSFLERIALLEQTTLIREKSDHVAIRLRAPLNRAAIRRHYPSIDRLHGWIKALVVTITDARGRELARIQFDGSRRVFRLDAQVGGEGFLFGDGDRPLRDEEGRPLRLGFRLTESQSLQLHVELTTALIKLGRLRLGSCRLPDSRWDLELSGSATGDRALWNARVGSIDEARGPLAWLLPLGRILDLLEQTFALRIELAPREHDDRLHDLEIDYGLETPRSRLLDLAETLLRWGSRSNVFRGLLGVWHDLADSLAADLEALARNASAGVDDDDEPGGDVNLD